MLISPGILIFWATRGSGGQGGRGKRAKIAQNGKSELHPSRIISYEQYSIWSWFLVLDCVKEWYLQAFWFFVLLGGVGGGGGKGKNSPKWKIRITSVTHLSQEQYSIWSWFLIQLCEMMTSPSRCFSHFFKILIFRVVRRVKGQKMTHNYQFQSVKLSEKLHVIKIFGTLL